MDEIFDNDKEINSEIKNALMKFFLSLALAFIIAAFTHTVWVKQLSIYHTILELICVFMALSVFWCVWYNYKQNSLANVILALGFLMVAIFDALHSFYSLKLNASTYYNLSIAFWILGRYAQAAAIICYTFRFKGTINKWFGLTVTVFVIYCTSALLIYHHDIIPILITEVGVTPLKIGLEYIIIAVFIMAFYRLKDRKYDDNTINCSYVSVSLLLMTPVEIIFALNININSMIWNTGHILKITSYYFLFKAVVKNIFIYSYENLEREHKSLEKAVEEINGITQTLSDILEALPFGVYMYDDNARIKYVNSKFEEILQCSRTDFYGLDTKEVARIFQRVDGDEESLAGIVHKSKGKDIKTLRNYKLPNGEYKKVSITLRKINGGVIALLREAKEEQALSNLNLQTETILDAVSSGVLMIGTNKKIILCNKAFEELVEMDKKDIIGMNIDDLNKMVKYTGGKYIEEALAERDDGRIKEASLTSLKGNLKELNVHADSIKNVDGDIIGAISITTDITDMKKEQARLREQEKLALLGQLSAGIVHETRNFLTTIKGRCQLIGAISNDKIIKEYAKKIDNDVDEVNSIISEFLFLSRPRQTKFKEVSMFDISQSIKNIVENSYLFKGIDVNMTLSNEERYLLCDEIQIKQVILNICRNAVEAVSCRENPRIDIETGFDEAKNEMFIKICDNGNGMNEETTEKLGTMFYTTKKSGTGLGLNVCYKIIKEHNGRIDVKSKLGKGTTFKIILPCIEDTDEDDEIIFEDEDAIKVSNDIKVKT